MTRIKNSKGFTLIELIVVIVIIGILAAIAAVAYTQFIANAEATSVETGADQIVRALDAEQTFTQQPVTLETGTATADGSFPAGVLNTWDKNTNTYVDASASLIADLSTAANNNTVTVTGANNTGTIELSDGSYECSITVPNLVKTCAAVTP